MTPERIACACCAAACCLAGCGLFGAPPGWARPLWLLAAALWVVMARLHAEGKR